ncbi:hypothetical protein [Actinacidiphila sp. ITFR-21]|uniref:hypothetical protein n=1 Tax=Actinacidiphila sp. ITFR-21 TaxID=3075199 RepID=UPI00288A797B|nr:hypothetical protein [Streptomyces sp. ITFR-21]WNI15104.1 hypothetical protein RLT57_05860 [Streptomyces sp. ITFR-21]
MAKNRNQNRQRDQRDRRTGQDMDPQDTARPAAPADRHEMPAATQVPPRKQKQRFGHN